MTVLTVLIKAVVGGTFVTLFALIGETIRPRALAGLTSGAPSVAAAGLLVTVISAGVVSAQDQALGMIAGGVALVLWCLVGVDAVKRFGALKGSVVVTPVWIGAALALWALVLK